MTSRLLGVIAGSLITLNISVLPAVGGDEGGEFARVVGSRVGGVAPVVGRCFEVSWRSGLEGLER